VPVVASPATAISESPVAGEAGAARLARPGGKMSKKEMQAFMKA